MHRSRQRGRTAISFSRSREFASRFKHLADGEMAVRLQGAHAEPIG